MSRFMDTYHSVRLNKNDEKRFTNAVAKKFGVKHGVISKALYEAVMQWVEKVEKENVN